MSVNENGQKQGWIGNDAILVSGKATETLRRGERVSIDEATNEVSADENGGFTVYYPTVSQEGDLVEIIKTYGEGSGGGGNSAFVGVSGPDSDGIVTFTKGDGTTETINTNDIRVTGMSYNQSTKNLEVQVEDEEGGNSSTVTVSLEDLAGVGGHLLKLDDSAPENIEDDVYTGGGFYIGNKTIGVASTDEAGDESVYFSNDLDVSRFTKSVLIGYAAGALTDGTRGPNGTDGQVFVGYDAGYNAETFGDGCVFVGLNAGKQTENLGIGAVFIGKDTGLNVNFNNGQPVVIGSESGKDSDGIGSAVSIGNKAFKNASVNNNPVAIGLNAGEESDGNGLVAVGPNAGKLHFGYGAVCIGTQAGISTGNSSRRATQIVAVGANAGQNAGNTFGPDDAITGSVFLGPYAGNGSTKEHQIMIGDRAGLSHVGANSIAIGNRAAWNASGDQTIYLGQEAGRSADGSTQNTMSNKFIIKNDYLPSFADRAAAEAAITTANGAVTDNTYLYYNETTHAVEGVRL